jgi:cell division protein FtsQ
MAIKAMMLLVLAGALGAALYIGASSDTFRLRSIVIQGNRHLSKADLKSLMRIKGGENLLFLSCERLYERLHSSPWIKDARLRKELPRKLVVRIVESEPQALVRRPDGFAIVDADGIELEGISGAQELFLPVINGYGRENTPVFQEALKLSGAINRTGIQRQAREIEIVGLSGGTKDLSMHIDGLEVKVGEGGYEEKLNRLYELVQEIRSRPFEVDYVDLRFANRVIVKPVVEVVQ